VAAHGLLLVAQAWQLTVLALTHTLLLLLCQITPGHTHSD
jgi:hypothetical protein